MNANLEHELAKIHDEQVLYDMLDDVDRIRIANMLFGGEDWLTQRRDMIVQRLKQVNPDQLFHEPMFMSRDEVVNGYHLYDLKQGEAIMTYRLFKHLTTLFNQVEEPGMNLHSFLKMYGEAVCSDWGKMDECGNCFGGFYDYPEGSMERDNAFNLTYNRNGRALFKLPFNKRFLIETIHMGCSTRKECVRYSNFIGEWIRRKQDLINFEMLKKTKVLSDDLFKHIRKFL